MTIAPPSPPKLYRADQGRLIAGVAAGLAEHLAIDVKWLRLAFVVLAFVGGAGVLLYAALWIVVPVAPSPEGSTRTGSASTLLLSLGAVGIGVVLLLQLFQLLPASAVPVGLVLLGAALVWLRSDEDQRQRFARRATGRDAPGRLGVLQVVAGSALVLIGTAAFLASRGSLVDVGRVLLAALVVTVGVGLLAAPWAIGLMRDRDAERRARIRSEERADIAAHVHDSVLQTLTLIQRNAADPGAVARLARSQERDLRHWLYEPVPDAAATVRGALEAVVAEVEDVHGVPIELVCVSDTSIDDRLMALVQAAREAMVNAAKYGGLPGPVAVYAEVADDEVAVFVRDRGQGFDLADIPEDRRGVRESIIGRMNRNGGTAAVRRMDGAGTQVELRMKVAS